VIPFVANLRYKSGQYKFVIHIIAWLSMQKRKVNMEKGGYRIRYTGV